MQKINKLCSFKKKLASIKEVLKKEIFRKYKLVFYFILIISVLLELFVFNFRCVESVFNNEIKDLSYTVSNSKNIGDNEYRLPGTGAVENENGTYAIKASGYKQNSDGTYTVEVYNNDNKESVITSSVTQNKNGTYNISDSRVYIEIDNINTKLKNVKLDIKRTVDKGHTNIRLWAVDEANSLGIFAPNREITDEFIPSKYIRTHFSGKVEKLRIYISAAPGEIIKINDIKLNTRVPLYFSIERFLFTVFALMILFILRPKSFIYKHKLDFKIKWQIWTAIILLAMQVMFIWGLCQINPPYQDPHWVAHGQYQELADSFLDGHTYLVNKEPSEELMAMENPYDTNLRSKLKVSFEWDHAYRNGHYYVYFGIVPEVVFFLPFKVVTGNDFPNYLAVFICCSAMCFAVMFLLYSVIRKWFKNTSFGIYTVMCLLMTGTCGVMYMAKRPDFYSIPVAMAMVLSTLGTAFWIYAEQRDENGNTKLKARYLCFGSICMALVAGCRPHILITTLFGVILFWNAVFKERTLLSRKSVKETIAVCMPYIVVAAGIMIYNYIRFKSPFDFGANYNLTTNDMTRRGFVMDRNLTGLFYYLLQPLTVTNEFPYVQMVGVQSMYQGLTLTERMAGGLLWSSPIAWFAVRGMFKKNWYKNDNRPYIISFSAVLIAVVIAILDAQIAGILTRYYSDFSWILLFGAAIAVFAEYDLIDSEIQKRKFISVIFVCFIISAVVYGLNIFNDVDNSVLYNNPWLYYKMKYLIGFLL